MQTNIMYFQKAKEKSHWVQKIIHNPMVTFTVSPEVFEGTARIVDKHNQPKLVQEVSILMHAKYGWSNGLIVELTPYKEKGNRI